MPHDSTKVLMGTTQSTWKVSENVPGALAAGIVVHGKSDGTFTAAKADGVACGISLGISQSDTSRMSIVKKGTRVPILLTSGLTPVVGTQVSVDDTTGKAKAPGGGVTAVNAVYVTSKLTSVSEAGVETANDVALIDFPGGL
jgi:hypothetical protein